MSDEALRRRLRDRAKELWEADGRPAGRDLEYLLEAEAEFAPYAVPSVGEEDPQEALDHEVTPDAGKGRAG